MQIILKAIVQRKSHCQHFSSFFNYLTLTQLRVRPRPTLHLNHAAPISCRFLSSKNLVHGSKGNIIVNLDENRKVSFKDVKTSDSKDMRDIMKELNKFGKHTSLDDVKKSVTSARRLRNEFIEKANISKYRQTMVDNLNSLLYFFDAYNKSEDLVETFRLMESKMLINEASYSSLIKHKTQTEDWRSGLQAITEMKSKGIEPHSRTYHCLICNAVEIGDLDDALSLFKDMHNLEVIFSDEFYSSLIDTCMAHQKNSNAFLLKIFGFMEDTGFSLGKKSFDKATTWFSSHRNDQDEPVFDVKISPINIRGECSNCKSQLKEFSLPEATRQNLQDKLLQVAVDAISNKKEQNGSNSLQQLLQVSNIHSASPSAKIDALRHLVNISGPFDVVLDVLNIAYTGSKGFNSFQVKRVAKHFVDQGQKVLALCSSPLLSSIMNSKEDNFSNQHMVKLLHYLKRNQCGIFFVDDSKEQGHIDDYFLLLSIVFQNMNIDIVTADNFFDHVHSADAVTKRHFQRWKRSHQIVLKNFTSKGIPVFAPRAMFDIDVQNKGDSWHLPSSTGEWLCCTQRLPK